MVSWGILATLTSPLTAITIAGVLLLATPLLLPTRIEMSDPAPVAAADDVQAA